MWSCWCRPTAGSGCRMRGIHPRRLTTPRPKPCLHDATRNKNVWVMPSAKLAISKLYYYTILLKVKFHLHHPHFWPSPPTPCHRRRCRCCCRRRTRRQTSFTPLGPSSVASRYRAHGARCRHSPILHCCFPLLMRYYYTLYCIQLLLEFI